MLEAQGRLALVDEWMETLVQWISERTKPRISREGKLYEVYFHDRWICTPLVACLQEDSGEASPTAAHQAVLDSNISSGLGADLAEALPLLCGNGLPQALQAAFQLADPGFAAPIAQALQVLSTRLLSTSEHADCLCVTSHWLALCVLVMALNIGHMFFLAELLPSKACAAVLDVACLTR